MKTIISLVLFLTIVGTSQAQLRRSRLFVKSEHSTQNFVQSETESQLFIRTGFSDVHCINGVCFIPSDNFDFIQIPQSTAFFGLSNPQALSNRIIESAKEESRQIIFIDN